MLKNVNHIKSIYYGRSWDTGPLWASDRTGYRGWSIWGNIVFPDLSVGYTGCVYLNNSLSKTFKAHIRLSVSMLYFN